MSNKRIREKKMKQQMNRSMRIDNHCHAEEIRKVKKQEAKRLNEIELVKQLSDELRNLKNELKMIKQNEIEQRRITNELNELRSLSNNKEEKISVSEYQISFDELWNNIK